MKINNKMGLLVELLRYEPIKNNLDQCVLSGLSGKTQIDYAIGVIESTYQKNPDNITLKLGYEALQQRFSEYFLNSSKKTKKIETKPDAYKANNGF